MSASGLCLTVLLACVIVDTLVEGGILRRHRGHHSRVPEYRGAEEPTSLDLWPRRSDDRREERRDDTHRGQREEERLGGYLEARANYFQSSDYEDVVEARPRPVVHRRRHVTRNEGEDEGSLASFSRKMHRNRHLGNRGSSNMDARARLLESQHQRKLSKLYELEVRDVQNSSVCNYTVVPEVVDSRSRTPEVLEHVKCNHAGSSCLGVNDTYCCIQTYKMIKVRVDGKSEDRKLYVGCVCAREVLLEEPRLPTYD